jgi:hypothetical protein
VFFAGRIVIHTIYATAASAGKKSPGAILESAFTSPLGKVSRSRSNSSSDEPSSSGSTREASIFSSASDARQAGGSSSHPARPTG